jgi:hypothetical protein
LIHGIGRVERQPAGVQISMAMNITARDLSIYDCARAGINVSEGTWGGHLIERCDVFDTVLETHDHGSFNSWGRDRFWHKSRGVSQAEINKDPKLPFLDAMKTTTIRDSRWRCDHGWDIDLDDGSTNYDIYNNLMLNNGLKLREGFRRHAWNNITVNNGLHPHVWYQGSQDQVYSNIFMAPHKPAGAIKTGDDVRVDDNFFAVDEAAVMKVSQKLGWDQNSVYGDPMFVDPAKGDFRVKPDSPALKVGFKNFPMDQFGVKKPSLKAIARTPEIPQLMLFQESGTKAATARSMEWLGATLTELSGVEFSAYGVSQADGGVALSGVGPRTQAAKVGLQNEDLIQAVNGRKTPNVKQFNRATAKAKGTIQLKVVRDQQAMDLEVTL